MVYCLVFNNGQQQFGKGQERRLGMYLVQIVII